MLYYLNDYYNNIDHEKLMIEKISNENKARYNCCYLM